MRRFEDNIISLVGPPFIGLTPVAGVGLNVEGFTVKVLTFPALAVAAIFSDNGTTAAANPRVVGSDGSFFFYVADGRYQLEIEKLGILKKILPDVLISASYKTVSIGTPAVVPANSTLEHTVTLAGIAVGDFVAVVKPTHQTGLLVGTCRVSAANTLAVPYMNTTAAGITPTAAEIYIVSHNPAS
ncbi:MAG: hypothetical protein ACRD98_00435 [Nitrososphaera sp.]